MVVGYQALDRLDSTWLGDRSCWSAITQNSTLHGVEPEKSGTTRSGVLLRHGIIGMSGYTDDCGKLQTDLKLPPIGKGIRWDAVRENECW